MKRGDPRACASARRRRPYVDTHHGREAMTLTTAKRLMAALVAVLAATGAAHAITINNLYEDYSRDEISSALILTMTTEAYRHLLEGREAQAQCITQNFMVRRDKAGKEVVPKPLSQLLEALNGLKDRDDRYVEDYLLGATNQFCAKAKPLRRDQKPEIFRLAVPAFFAVPTDRERSIMIFLAVSTQAFRMQVTGARARGECLMQNLLPQKDAQGRTSEPAGLKQLAAQLYQARDQRDQTVESYIWGSINHYCPGK
jgi:hypothetical protein